MDGGIRLNIIPHFWGGAGQSCRAQKIAFFVRLIKPTLFVLLCVGWFNDLANAQTQLSSSPQMTQEIRAKLSQKVSLDLRDATLLDALFAVRDTSGLNMVVGNEVTGTVNASFVNSSVFEVLDSLLITRGYGYRIVGGSLAVVPLSSLGKQLPLFETSVIQLEHSTVADLLTAVESQLSPEGSVSAVASSNALVVNDYPSQIAKVRTQIAALEEASARHRQTRENPTLSPAIAPGESNNPQLVVRVIHLQYVAADVMSEAIRPLLSPSGQVAAVPNEDKLIVTDSAEYLSRVDSAVVQLDLPRPQVRIWAMIYDCSIEDLQRIGVNWRSGMNSAALNPATGAPQQQAMLDTVTSIVSGAPNGLLTLTSLNSHTDISAIIQALNTADDSRLLADPNVVVMNHESAEIAIVTEVPYQQLTQGIEGGTIGTTEFREAGVTLKVTPHIAQDETISLIVNPKFSLLTGFSDPDNAPIIDRRETSTTVRIANMQTLVLGGLRQRTRIAQRSSIPLLGKLPYLGHLFRHKNNTARESELMVFITPQIIMPDYAGTPREACISQQLNHEIEQAPTAPIPFGIDIMNAEDRARARETDQCWRSQVGLRRRCPSGSSCDSWERLPLASEFDRLDAATTY